MGVSEWGNQKDWDRLPHVRKSPSYYEDIAVKHENAGEWEMAARAYRTAASVSLGHNRALRYQQAMRRCMTKAGYAENFWPDQYPEAE